MEYDWTDDFEDDGPGRNRCSLFFDEAYEMWLSAATTRNDEFRWSSMTVTANAKTMAVTVGKHELRLPLN